MLEDVSFYFKKQGVLNACFNLGFWSLLLYRLGRKMHGKLLYKFLMLWYIYLILKNLLLLLSKIELPPTAIIGQRLNLVHAYGLVMGDKVEIGDDVTIGPWVVIGHNGNRDLQPKIRNKVYVGAHACILGGISINNNSLVGCNAVITESMIEHSTAKVRAEIYKTKGF